MPLFKRRHFPVEIILLCVRPVRQVYEISDRAGMPPLQRAFAPPEHAGA